MFDASAKLMIAIIEIWGLVGEEEKDLEPDEAKVGSYGSLKGSKNLTPDHQPQDAVMKILPAIQFRVGGRLEDLFLKTPKDKIRNYSKHFGITFNMLRLRHERTRTFRSSGTKAETLAKMKVDGSTSIYNKNFPAGEDVDKARREVRSDVETSVTRALEDDQTVVKEIYDDDRWHLKSAERNRAKSKLSEVRDKNRSRWGVFR